jgi:hypothetical protein
MGYRVVCLPVRAEDEVILALGQTIVGLETIEYNIADVGFAFKEFWSGDIIKISVIIEREDLTIRRYRKHLNSYTIGA